MYTAKNNGKNSIEYEVFGTREWPAGQKLESEISYTRWR
jgi:hypothetical protein